ncbi:4-azaleucine resistance transporter AzlC [Frischella perrara]|uniref:Putative branched-chain amino acid permease (Azaleucine resistance) n=1 Tax=Frischella perrara TaxID=1267021 RepID=A0A0A7S1H1_FRIPE|nr:AzlC family ABC transporter permease [Frischella perrara]AJA45303.1 putative branched-chain amino acid permease (azaleucine resistance) [Frischella perrara]PWV62952.1 4-azaleucine resistance transporter AzlC [Frischella perrara]
MNSSFRKGIIDCIPTLFGYVGIGIAAGIIGKAANLTILEITLLSIIVYAGAAQFIITGLLLTTAPIMVIIFTVFLINLRHLLMGMTIAPFFKRFSLINNIGIGTLLTDETFAVAVNAFSQQKTIDANWMHGLNITAYLVWIMSCITGAILGNWLPDPYQFGFDFSLIAMFIGLLYLQFINDKKHSKLHNLFVIFIVAILMIFLMRIMIPELAIIVATLLGCFIGVLIEKCK